ncbi:MAG: hypothetical protein ACRDXX_03575, partial [Stackebrandtia sp.]
AYLWSAEESESAQSATDPVAGRVTPLEDGFVALPPLPLLEESPRLRDDIPAVLDVSEAAPLSEDPVDAIALAVQTTLGEQLAVLGDDGGVRVVDVASDQKGWRLFPRAVSPAADRVVLAGETQIRVVDSSGGIQDIDQDAAGLPPNVTDLAWFPDGEHLLATFEAESYSVDAESGESEPLNWHGSVSTFHPDTGDTVEFSSAGDDLVLQTWQGGDPTGEAYRAAEGALPIQTWRREAPFADASGFYVRACELREDFEVPPEYGEARECLAAVDAEASVLSVLALADVDVTSSVNLVVGTGGGKVFFAVPAGGPEQLLLAWTPADDTLRLVTTVTDPVAVGLL